MRCLYDYKKELGLNDMHPKSLSNFLGSLQYNRVFIYELHFVRELARCAVNCIALQCGRNYSTTQTLWVFNSRAQRAQIMER